MIDWIKYFPIKLYDRKGNEEIKGPDFSKSVLRSFSIADNSLQFSCPKNSSKKVHLGYGLRSVLCKKDECFNTFSSHKLATNVPENWENIRLFKTGWEYRAAWFKGDLINNMFIVHIEKRKPNIEFTNASFFHPRVFEYAISNYLNSHWGHNQLSDDKAPLNWKVHHHLPVPAASFRKEPMNSRVFFCFPVAHNMMIEFNFETGGNGWLKDHAIKLAYQVIDSVKLTLGPKTQAQLDSVKAQCSDMSLTPEFPPLKWPIKVEEIENHPPAIQQGMLNVEK